MNAKKEALELLDTFKETTDMNLICLSPKGKKIRDENARRCCLIHINKMIRSAELMDGGFSFQKEIEHLCNIKEELINLKDSHGV